MGPVATAYQVREGSGVEVRPNLALLLKGRPDFPCAGATASPGPQHRRCDPRRQT